MMCAVSNPSSDPNKMRATAVGAAASPLPPKRALCGGHADRELRDILRALDVLGPWIAHAEDARGSQVTDAYALKPRLYPYHDHSDEAVRADILAALGAGESVALISDAGTPLISDPGFKLTRAVIAAGHRVYPIPGASALLAGLVVAGVPSDRFLFAGFLSAKQHARRESLTELAPLQASLVFYESGPRLAESLADMAAILGDRPAAVARELTKLFEETRRDGLPRRVITPRRLPKGEIVVIVAPPKPRSRGGSIFARRRRAAA